MKVPRSPSFKKLEASLRQLRRQLLPRHFDPTGTYPERVIARSRGYRVLAHAEIEHFIEQRAQEVVLHALKTWNSTGAVRVTHVSLIAFCGRAADVPPATLIPVDPSAKKKHFEQLHLKERLKNAASAFFTALKENHGIKEINLLRLLLPIGLNPDEIDPTWLAIMNSFGERRGEAAHSSGNVGTVKHPPDPKSEFDLVVQVLKGLRDIDKLLNELMN